MDSRLRKTYFPADGYGGIHEVRIFDDATIQESIGDVLSGISPNKSGVSMRVRMRDGGVASVIAARLGSHWSIAAIIDKPKHAPLDVAVQGVFEW